MWIKSEADRVSRQAGSRLESSLSGERGKEEEGGGKHRQRDANIKWGTSRARRDRAILGSPPVQFWLASAEEDNPLFCFVDVGIPTGPFVI